MQKLFGFLSVLLLFSLTGNVVFGENQLTDTIIESEINNVQPMTGIVFWQGSNTNTDAISLEFSYMLFNEVVQDSDVYNWDVVDQKLNDIASRNHQAIFRFRYTYVGKQTSVPEYIKNRDDYHETEGISEGQTTWFPDWTCSELERFTLEFYTKFAERYDNDSRLAFIQVGFGLWAEYHIYDGPFILGKTFPSKEFQEQYFYHLDDVFTHTTWSISIDAADDTYAPFNEKPELKELRFGNFDDSFMHENHADYNAWCWSFFDNGRYRNAPAGGEFSYYTNYDQQHVLDYPNGAYGISYEDMARQFKISYIIGNDQPNYQTIDRIKEASMASGYKFHIIKAQTSNDSTILTIRNIGTAPIYYDAFPTVNGIRSAESLIQLAANETKNFHIAAGGSPFDVNIVCDRLLENQTIEFLGTNYSHNNSNKTIVTDVFPTLIKNKEPLKINTYGKDLCVYIYILTGELIYKDKLVYGQNLINTNNFSKGMYILKITERNNIVSTKKVMVQ